MLLEFSNFGFPSESSRRASPPVPETKQLKSALRGNQGVSKGAVHFRDVGLEQVREFKQDEPALLVNSKYNKRNLKILFWRNKTSTETLVAALSKAVAVEELDFSDPILSGTVVVKNISFEKHVFIRYSLDGWTTFRDHDAVYSGKYSDNRDDFDRFKFSLDMTDCFSEGACMSFAICFKTPTEEYWDNNSNLNYLAEMSATVLHSAFERDTTPDHTKMLATFKFQPSVDQISLHPIDLSGAEDPSKSSTPTTPAVAKVNPFDIVSSFYSPKPVASPAPRKAIAALASPTTITTTADGYFSFGYGSQHDSRSDSTSDNTFSSHYCEAGEIY